MSKTPYFREPRGHRGYRGNHSKSTYSASKGHPKVVRLLIEMIVRLAILVLAVFSTEHNALVIQGGGNSVNFRARKHLASSASTAEISASSTTPGNLLLPLSSALSAGFLFGYHVAVINPSLDAIAKSLNFVSSSSTGGLVVSSVLAGATIGSLGSGMVYCYVCPY